MFSTRTPQGVLPYIFGTLLGVSLGLVIISGILFFKSSRGDEPTESAKPEPVRVSQSAVPTMSIDESRRNAIVVATEKVAPAVVTVAARYTRVVRANPFRSRGVDSFFEWFFRDEYYQRKNFSSLGSGVVISPDGYVLTNYHVIQNAEVLEITLSTNETRPAEIVGSAADYDIALLKIDAEDLPYAELGDSDDLYVGEWAIAIGQPFGQLLYDTQPTVTVGVISALDRDVKGQQRDRIFKEMIQTDAAINPGNSGGPLVNSRGQVIGINTFIFSSGGGGSLGMGFAIPINRGKWVLEEIRNHGRVRDVWVGLTVRDITPELAAGLDFKSRRGLLIRQIDHGSPAAKAGLEPGDLIVKVNDNDVVSTYQANRIIFGSKIGEQLKFEVERPGSDKRRTLQLVLEEKPSEI